MASGLSHAVRVARALALVTGSASVSCGGDRLEKAGAPDAARAVPDGGRVDSPTAMSCIEAEEQVSCEPGAVCHVDTSYGYLHCDVPDYGVNKPCGAIQCGWLCACVSAAESTCECYGGAGPLPPPDLTS